MPNGKIRFSAIYGNGQVMGYSPQEVNVMSVFQYMACCDGFAKANGADEGLTAQEQDELWEWLQDG